MLSVGQQGPLVSVCVCVCALRAGKWWSQWLGNHSEALCNLSAVVPLFGGAVLLRWRWHCGKCVVYACLRLCVC